MVYDGIKYERITMNRRTSADLLAGNYQVYMLPNLPTIQFESSKAKYEITDLRCLNEKAVSCLMKILGEVCNTPNCEQVRLDMTGFEENEIQMISDILSGMTYKVYLSIPSRKKRYTLHGEGHFLVNGRYQKKNDGNIHTFCLSKENAKVIYEYAQGKESVNYYELAIAVAERLSYVS